VDPRATYEERLAAARERAERHAGAQARLSTARLVVFAAGLVVAWMTLGVRAWHPAWLAAPVAAFAALVVVHDRVIRVRERADRAVAWYAAGLARMADPLDPAGAERDGSRFADADHLYAADLDVFGAASLFAHLCRARSRAGEETLARWLREPAPPEEVRERQAAVAELRDRPDWREALALVGGADEGRMDPDALVAWGRSGGRGPSRRVRVAGALLSAASCATLAGGLWIFGTSGWALAVPFLASQAIFFGSLRGHVRAAVADVERAAGDLDRLSRLLEHLEGSRFESPRLVGLARAVQLEGHPPSHHIARLRRHVDRLEARRNQMYWVPPIGPLLGVVTQSALAIEAWRAHRGPHLGEWLAAVGEMEALASLATHAFEHPDDPFPEIDAGPPCFEGEGLGHPLLAESACVRNAVALGAGTQALVVSGSNMSGKSTLLRTVGCNAVLALAGAPVRASRLRLTPLRVGASIRVQDSLREGASRFYAEIRRIARIVEETEGDAPVLFLLDEVFHGTNSHDRRIGAEAVVRELLERGALGLVTTHDLALARVAEALAPRVRNVHFEDQLEGGRIRFDYRMREGVITRSNALALMRAVGLDVPEQGPTVGPEEEPA
jgi:hypothetical protein